MAGRHGQQELGAAAKFSPRKFSEKIALLNKKEAEGNAEFEEIIKEVQATTKRVACVNMPAQAPIVVPGAHQAIAPEQRGQSMVSTAAVAAQADDELEEVYQNLMSCQYDEDKDIVDSSSEVSSGARDQIEDIKRSIREDTVAPVVVEHHCAQALVYAPKGPHLERDEKFSGTPAAAYGPDQLAQGYYRVRGTSVGSTRLEQAPEVVCYGWPSGPCNDYLNPSASDRMQWQKSSSDPALNSASHKLAPALPAHPNQATCIHGSCSENFIQGPAETAPALAEAPQAPSACYGLLEQRQDLPGIKICAIEDLEAAAQIEDLALGPPVIVHAGHNAELSLGAAEKGSTLPEIAKLQFSGPPPTESASAEVHRSDMSQWPPVAVRPDQMDFAEEPLQRQADWMRTQVSPVSDLGHGDDPFESKPVNSLLSSSECGLQYNHLNQCGPNSASNAGSPAGRRHHHHHHHHHHQLNSSIHQQRLKAAAQDQIMRSHSHNNISYVTKQRRLNCTQSATGGGRGHLFGHHHLHHHQLQHRQLQHQQHQQQLQPMMSDYEHQMGQFGLQVGCPRHLEGAKSSASSVRPQFGSISPINSPASQPTSPQSENQSSPAADPLACPDSYLPYPCGVAAAASQQGPRAAAAFAVEPQAGLFRTDPCQPQEVYKCSAPGGAQARPDKSS